MALWAGVVLTKLSRTRFNRFHQPRKSRVASSSTSTVFFHKCWRPWYSVRDFNQTKIQDFELQYGLRGALKAKSNKQDLAKKLVERRELLGGVTTTTGASFTGRGAGSP
jgi:hypothetical protein